jgi:hypothetical protein
VFRASLRAPGGSLSSSGAPIETLSFVGFMGAVQRLARARAGAPPRSPYTPPPAGDSGPAEDNADAKPARLSGSSGAASSADFAEVRAALLAAEAPKQEGSFTPPITPQALLKRRH